MATKKEKKVSINLTARIDKLMDGAGDTKAYASLTIGDAFAVHGVRIIEKDDKLSVYMPYRSYKAGAETKYADVFHAITAEARTKIIDVVTEAYQMALEQQMADLEHEGAAMSQQM